jgi:hypothetical protein
MRISFDDIHSVKHFLSPGGLLYHGIAGGVRKRSSMRFPVLMSRGRRMRGSHTFPSFSSAIFSEVGSIVNLGIVLDWN